MKKKLFLGLLAAAAVSFTACQKDEVLNEVQQDEAISFSTYLGRGAQTKGTVINEDILGGQGFGVIAYYTGQQFTGEDHDGESYTFPTAPNFMNNVKVYKSDWDQKANTENTWGYESIKYWPNTLDDKISFYAYAPHSGNTPLQLTVVTYNDGAAVPPTLSYFYDDKCENHIDVLFAPAQVNKTKENGVVNMTFYHALSKVGFKVKTLASYNNAKILLKSVTLSGTKFISSATMDLTRANVETVSGVTTVNPGWVKGQQNLMKYQVSEKSTEKPNGTEVNSTTSRVVGTDGQYFMIFPQEFTGNGDDKITLTAEYTVDGIENSVSKDLGAFKFEAGKAYTFVISIGLATVDFTANVVDWDTTPGDTTVDINASTN